MTESTLASNQVRGKGSISDGRTFLLGQEARSNNLQHRTLPFIPFHVIIPQLTQAPQGTLAARGMAGWMGHPNNQTVPPQPIRLR